MNKNNIRIFEKNDWPIGIKNIYKPPQKLFIIGENPDKKYKFLTIIGPRKPTKYSIDVANFLIKGLSGFPIYIVSGLAYGIDTVAHELAIENDIKTIAFPGSGLEENVIYPKTNLNLAKKIVEQNGCLVSEYKPNELTRPYFFPQRNRLMAGIADAILIIEASEKSGSMITARFALEYGKEVLCVPGSIFNHYSSGVNYLIKQGATPISNPDEIIEILGLEKNKSEFFSDSKNQNLNDLELQILTKIKQGMNYEQILQETKIEQKILNQIISILEINKLV